MNSLKKELLQMTHAAPTNITLSAIAGIYILAQVIIVPALPDLGIIFSVIIEPFNSVSLRFQ